MKWKLAPREKQVTDRTITYIFMIHGSKVIVLSVTCFPAGRTGGSGNSFTA